MWCQAMALVAEKLIRAIDVQEFAPQLPPPTLLGVIHFDTAERGAGYFLPGIWVCTLDLEVPRIGGYRGLIDTTSTIFLITIVREIFY